MTVTQLTLYNGALRELGERKLASLSENREPRRALDDVYESALKYCLEQGHWKFAQRTSKITYAAGFTPSFGYLRQFAKPSDLVKLSRISADEYLVNPLLHYTDEAGFWFADIDDIYVSYVSNDASYGGDKTLWPATYVLWVERYLASLVAKRLTQSSTDLKELKKETEAALDDALAKDAIQGPVKFAPEGAWTAARRGAGAQRRVIGHGPLIG